eukprot:m.212469 g.212469  ORF g.212469 m.212469 type:complete len:229 (+) comp39773_c0_seq5:587-1273(+)
MSSHRTSHSNGISPHGKGRSSDNRKALREREKLQRQREMTQKDREKEANPFASALFPSGPPLRADESDSLTNDLKECLGEFDETYKQMKEWRSGLIGVPQAPQTPVDAQNTPFEFKKELGDKRVPPPIRAEPRVDVENPKKPPEQNQAASREKKPSSLTRIHLPPRGLIEKCKLKKEVTSSDGTDSGKIESILKEMTLPPWSVPPWTPVTDAGMSTPLKDPQQARFED